MRGTKGGVKQLYGFIVPPDIGVVHDIKDFLLTSLGIPPVNCDVLASVFPGGFGEILIFIIALRNRL